MMKIQIACAVFALIISSCLAQITFTREWVTGKRSSPSTMSHSLDNTLDLNADLSPAIEFLMKAELLRRKEGDLSNADIIAWNRGAPWPVKRNIRFGKGVPYEVDVLSKPVHVQPSHAE